MDEVILLAPPPPVTALQVSTETLPGKEPPLGLSPGRPWSPQSRTAKSLCLGVRGTPPEAVPGARRAPHRDPPPAPTRDSLLICL